MKIFFINFRNLFHSHDTFAVDNGHMKLLLQVFIDRMTGNLGSKAGNGFLQKIIMVDDQWDIFKIMDTLNIIYFCTSGKSCVSRLLFADTKLCKESHLCMGILTVPCSRFLEGFNLSDGESSLLVWTVDIADTFSLHGLYIAVIDKKTDRTAQGIAGTAVSPDQSVFGRQKLLIGKSVVLYFHFQIFINIFVNTSGHFNSPFMFGQKYIAGFIISGIIIKDFPGKRNANTVECLNKLQSILICYEDSMRNIDEINLRPFKIMILDFERI